MNFIRRTAALVLAAVLVLSLCACDAVSAGTLRVWVYSQDYAEQMKRAFTNDHPAVRWDIEYTVVSLDELDTLLAEAEQEGTLPDVLMLAPDNLARYTASGITADLSGLGITSDADNRYAYTLSGCTDEAGAFDAVFLETDDYYEGYAVNSETELKV